MNPEIEKSHKAEHLLESTTRIAPCLANDKMLHAHIELLGENIQITREIFNVAKEILHHRDGTFFEDLAFVDSISYKSIINKDYDYYDPKNKVSACKPNKPMLNMLKASTAYTLIGIHNHPQSHIPSDSDLLRAYERKYKYGLIFCHNGLIFKYFVQPKFDLLQASFFLAILEKRIYNKDEAKIALTLENLKEVGIDMEVFK